MHLFIVYFTPQPLAHTIQLSWMVTLWTNSGTAWEFADRNRQKPRNLPSVYSRFCLTFERVISQIQVRNVSV